MLNTSKNEFSIRSETYFFSFRCDSCEIVHSFVHSTLPNKWPTCSACFCTAATLRRPELEKYMKGTEPIFIVDEERGIFATSQEKSGPRTIVHVCKSFKQQVLDCELESCRKCMANGKECGL